ncbi:MAG: glycosyltransferase [Flavobacteriales bacterium]|nr:glycosyltransferase [Flavobacteriales bacterium]
MILFLTYNDQPSGVYWSQVCDVVAHLNTLEGPRVRLVALVSARGYFSIRRKVRAHSPDAIVLPMVPRMKRWRANAALVALACRWFRPTGIMARGVLATWMALRAREKGLVKHVCFDARGAYAAEWEEYRIVDDDALIGQFRDVEGEAVRSADVRLAVSEALVRHWRERYGYTGEEHVVVPCTLGRAHEGPVAAVGNVRSGLGFTESDVVLVYSGSVAGWQSFELLGGILGGALEAQRRLKVLFLSPPDNGIDRLAADFPGRVVRQFLKAEEVPPMLQACDAALLVREDTLTNRVASPTKFAEYLAAGLPVVISAHIGDLSALVEGQGLGAVWREGATLPALERPSSADRAKYRAFAVAHFTKKGRSTEYRSLLGALA